MYDLSVLIPARNEEWLSRTVADVCANKRGNTEVIVVLDGAWPAPGLDQHPDVQVLHHHTAIGQRAATNLAARVSAARYIMKLDAHCGMAEGFDVALVQAAEALGRETVQIPAQRHLHVFNFVCQHCGHKRDQSPAEKVCAICKRNDWGREIVWQPRVRPTSTTWRFDAELHFQYWADRRGKPHGDYPEVMSCLGACWFLDREWYWHLDGLDEDHGSWGQMGTEIACKAWLSGGRMVCHKATWFAHFFRVGGHKFPYEIHASEQDYARRYSQNLWRGNNWPGQKYPLRWLVDQFWPVAGWTEAQRAALPERLGSSRVLVPAKPSASAGIVYYSHGQGDDEVLTACREQLKRAAGGLPIVASQLKPHAWGATKSIVLAGNPGVLTMFLQILVGLEALDTEFAFLAEHDVLYSADHFTFRPPTSDTYYYSLSWWKVDAESGRAITYTAKQVSQLCANRQLLIEHYRKRIARVEKDGFSMAMGYEPGSHSRPERVDDVPSAIWCSSVPNIDIRHGSNLTPSRWSRDQFRDQKNCRNWQEADAVPGWGRTAGRFREFLSEVAPCLQPQ